MDLFKETFVWRRVDATLAIRYSCLQRLGTSDYCVQSADDFHVNSVAPQHNYFQKQFLELFIDANRLEMIEWFEELETAIRQFDTDFGEVED
ncbi:hypothetical protein ABLO27_10750 [Roseibium sp. SCPC15]|uniref:hypothetical protein n=1 Tax=Roseibium sp. SCP15 TaxID=3141376 RepID=UPI00333DC12C